MSQRIDSHQHFWKFDPVRDSWIDESMQRIQKDFLPQDLLPVLEKNNFSGCVAVQADQTEAQTQFLLDLARENDFIKGVVGWVDLLNKNVAYRLDLYSHEKKLKGFRHVVQGEPDNFMYRSDFRQGIRALEAFNYTYDILIYPHQLPAAIDLANQFPDQAFVLDHIAKPDIKSGHIQFWKANIIELAKAENVLCKISGMVTEANWKTWTSDDLKPYLDVVFEHFTPNRLLFGSDWPVCLVASEYDIVVKTLEDYIAQLPTDQQEMIWFRNAERFYGLK
ncbi:MAG: amidohydrolase family protein [Bacteroidota bacterium]